MENKKAKNVLLAIMGVLIIVEIVARIATIQIYPTCLFSHLLSLLALVFTAVYGLWLYKTPHGNMLKYAMLLFGIANVLDGSTLSGNTLQIIRMVASAVVCFGAGRLNRIDQNKYLFPIIGIVYLVVSVVVAYRVLTTQQIGLIRIVAGFNVFINYITLMIAYFVRFEEHKVAGLTDALKN